MHMDLNVPTGTTIAQRLTTARQTAGLTNEQLAEAVGVDRKTVTRWQSDGAGSIKAEKLLLLADVLDVDATWLLVGGES
jgi:transcriptional regulator with XRE-family HTH domain